MGSFSICCAVSGLPISYSQEIVMVPVEKKKSGYSDHPWIPSDFPIFGEYDTYGSIDGYDAKSPHVVFCKEVWDNAKLYWHPENRYKENWLNWKYILKMARKVFGIFESWALNDLIYKELWGGSHGFDNGLILRNLDCGEPFNPGAPLYLERTIFIEKICQKIADETFSENDLTILNKMLCLWSSPTLTGHHLYPVLQNDSVHTEQFPDLNRRIKIATFHKKLIADLSKKRKDNEDSF